MKVDILLNDRFYGAINVKCLIAKSSVTIDDDIVRQEVEKRLPLLKGKKYKLFV